MGFSSSWYLGATFVPYIMWFVVCYMFFSFFILWWSNGNFPLWWTVKLYSVLFWTILIVISLTHILLTYTWQLDVSMRDNTILYVNTQCCIQLKSVWELTLSLSCKYPHAVVHNAPCLHLLQCACLICWYCHALCADILATIVYIPALFSTDILIYLKC